MKYETTLSLCDASVVIQPQGFLTILKQIGMYVNVGTRVLNANEYKISV